MRRWVALMLLWGGVAAGAPPPDLAQAWSGVRRAMEEGLPKTAAEKLGVLEKEAVAQERWADAVKAVKERIRIEVSLGGVPAEEIMPRFRASIGAKPEPMRPLMELVLAHLYWQYFNENRWRFSQRTAVAGQAEGSDIAAWSLPRILDEIEAQFGRVLAYEPVLKLLPVDEYDVLLEKGTVPDAYRPTLYDFVAYEMIDFYSLGEQAGARPEDAVELDANGPALDDVSGFSFLIPEEAARRSHVLRALRLFQGLLKFHEKNADPSAYADADLQRLQFCRNQVVGENRDTRYVAALDHFAQKWKRHEIMARACALRARLALESGNARLAWSVAQQGASAYPQSAGAAQCRNLVREIEAPSVSFAAEQVWCEPWPEMEITYKNLKAVQFCAVPVTFEEMFRKRATSGGPGDEAAVAALRRRPAMTWDVLLPPASDYQEHAYRQQVPDRLSPGLYAVFASTDGAYVKEGRPVAWGLFRVSKLALVIDHNPNRLGGYVLAADTGEPVAGARVQVWRFDRKDAYKRGPVFETNGEGYFPVLGDQSGELLLYAEKDGQAAQTWGSVWKGGGRERYGEPETHVVFFTDRAIYRPGQTVQYKGIYFVSDKQRGNYYAVGGKACTVRFADCNGKLIAEQNVTGNDYGSFSGSFVIPRDRGTGQMSLSVPERGQTSFSVEEYKRPKFDVSMGQPEADARLGALVSLTGSAVSFSGVPVGGAKVAWRVVREVRFPDWWRGGLAAREAQEIAHGVTACDGDGRFTVSFFSKPDAKVDEKDEPVFCFRVAAEVTDATGETRAGERLVTLGYAAWQASVVCDEWQTERMPTSFGVRVQTHDGVGVEAKGSLKLFTVRQPKRVLRARLSACAPGEAAAEGGGDPADPENWADEDEVVSKAVQTGTNGFAKVIRPLKAGLYRVRFEARDASGKPVTARKLVRVVDPGADRLDMRLPEYFEAESWSVEPGETFRAVWGSGYASAYARVTVEQNGRELMRIRTEPGTTQRVIELPVTESMRGGVVVRTLFVRENRIYANSRRIDVPWSSKRLNLTWEHFTSRLEPGKPETWRAVVSDGRGEKAAAEVVAALYDRSLDTFVRQQWLRSFENFFNRCDDSRCGFELENRLSALSHLFGQWDVKAEEDAWAYRSWDAGYGRDGVSGGGRGGDAKGARFEDAAAGVPVPMAAAAAPAAAQSRENWPAPEAAGDQALKVRRNLQETAFFLPQLVSDENGVVSVRFTGPEALTGWRFMAFAHDKGLRGGYLEAEAVTAKDLMVEPNPPRFVREGDEVAFAVKVANRSLRPQRGRARLEFCDAVSLKGVNDRLGIAQADREFELEPAESVTLEWRLRVPDGLGFLTYKAVAVTEGLADGEEGWLPVLSRCVAVRESMPLTVRGKGTKSFTFEALKASKKSQTIRHQNLTVQMVSQPAWCAVLALPYLMEYPHACCEQTFNRYYANALAAHIAGRDPKIRAVFDQWKGTDALASPLERNAEMKAVMIEETPWQRDATDGSAARRNISVLFDPKRLADERAGALRKLEEARISDGSWPWFPGGNRCDYVTLYIVAGFGRLKQLGVPSDLRLAVEALPRLDAWMTEEYRAILRRGKKDENHLTATVALSLYARSFFIKEVAVDAANRAAFDYFSGQAKRYWQKAGLQSQAHLALALRRLGDANVSAAILNSIRERATVSGELGMFWRDAEQPWSWAQAPIETQALMIETLLEVAGDETAAEACKVWLLRRKQAQDWRTTKATADAVYALLLRGANLLGSDVRAEVSLAGVPVAPEKAEAGTGFYERRFGPAEIKPEMGAVTVSKADDGVAWGAVHWQYLEELANLTPSDHTPLAVQKRLFVKEYTVQGPVLRTVAGALPQGAELVTRLEVRADRDMEFVHLKDARASACEPVNVVSGYRWQDGLGYYESTRDTATHFFVDYLPKGVYVFEYACRLQQKGVFRCGAAVVQCLYAPEFGGHSESATLSVE